MARQDQELQMLDVALGDRQIEIAVRYRPGATPGLFWLGGFRSTMAGTKAAAIDEWAKRRSIACIRFDYSGHGLSSGAFVDGTISSWLGEASAVYEAFAKGPQILIGSSMGGWLALLLAKALAETGATPPVKGLVLIAPATNMTRDLMWNSFDPETQRTIREMGIFERPSAYASEPDAITHALIEDGAQHCLDNKPMRLGVPVKIIQGLEDKDVPWDHAVALAERLAYDEAVLTLVKDGDHRLSREQDIELLLRVIGGLANQAD